MKEGGEREAFFPPLCLVANSAAACSLRESRSAIVFCFSCRKNRLICKRKRVMNDSGAADRSPKEGMRNREHP